MRRAFAVAISLVLLAAALILPAVGTASGSQTKKVRVGDDLAFHPSHLRIRKNTRVRWTWDGGMTHNVTLVKAPKGVKKFHSRDQMSGTYSHVFKVKGTYTLKCTIHDFSMTIKVT